MFSALTEVEKAVPKALPVLPRLHSVPEVVQRLLMIDLGTLPSEVHVPQAKHTSRMAYSWESQRKDGSLTKIKHQPTVRLHVRSSSRNSSLLITLTLLCSPPEPPPCRAVALLHRDAVGVNVAQVRHGIHVPRICRLAKVPHRLLILPHTPVGQQMGHRTRSVRMTVVSKPLVMQEFLLRVGLGAGVRTLVRKAEGPQLGKALVHLGHLQHLFGHWQVVQRRRLAALDHAVTMHVPIPQRHLGYGVASCRGKVVVHQGGWQVWLNEREDMTLGIWSYWCQSYGEVSAYVSLRFRVAGGRQFFKQAVGDGGVDGHTVPCND